MYDILSTYSVCYLQNDVIINEQLKRFTQDPVLVIIQAEPKDLGLPTEAYIEVQEVHDVSEIQVLWNKISLYLIL